MGVRSFTSYIQDNFPHSLITTTLQNSTLIIDGSNIFLNMYRELDANEARYGVMYRRFAETLTNFLQQLKSCNIKPIVVSNGLHYTNKEALIEKWKTSVIRHEEEDNLNRAPLLYNVYIEILRKMEITLILVPDDAHYTIQLIAKKYNCPVLSHNGNFFFYGVKYFRDVEVVELCSGRQLPEAPTMYGLKGKIFDFKIFKRGKFRNIDESLFLLALIVLGRSDHVDYLNFEIVKPFFARLSTAFRNNYRKSLHNKIEQTLMWLNHYTKVDDAIADLLACIDKKHREEILCAINRHSHALHNVSRPVLEYLGIDNETISNLIAEHDEKSVKLQSNLNELEIPKILKLYSDIENNGSEELGESLQESGKQHQEMKSYEEFSEKNLYETIPLRLLNDHIVGKNRGYCIEMLAYKTVFFYHKDEFTRWGKYENICLPIIHAIFSVMTSSLPAKRNTLELYEYNGSQIIMEKISIQRSSIQLHEIDHLPVNKRISFLNKTLGLHPQEDLKDIPDCWKLYITTVVFWMRSNGTFKKDISYLRAVLFTILYGVVEKKMATEQESGAVSLMFAMEQYTVHRKPSLQKFVDSITEEDCMAVRALLNDQMRTAVKTADFQHRIDIVNTIGQLGICLMYTIELNALLNFPFENIVIHELMDDNMLYNLFMVFRQEKQFSKYLANRFGNVPNVIAFLSEFETIVMTLIDG